MQRKAPTLLSALSVGTRRVLFRPRLVCGLWFLSLFTAVLATLPAGLALYDALLDRPAAARLARGQADVLWGELLSVSGDSALRALGPMLLGGTASGLFLFWLAQVLISGGVTSALIRPGHPICAAPGRVLLRAAETAAAMLRLELFSLLALRLPLILLFGVSAYLVSSRLHLMDKTATAVVLAYAPLLIISCLLWAMGSIAMHYARLFRLSQPEASARTTAALRGGLRLACEAPGSLQCTFFLGLLSIIGFALLIVFGRVLASRLDYALLVGLAFALRQGFALLRTLLSLSLLAAATEVWHHHET